MRIDGHDIDALTVVRKADGADAAIRPQRRDRAVVVAGPIAQAVAFQVKGNQWDKENLRTDDGGAGAGMHGAKRALVEGIARFPGPEDQHPTLSGHDRERHLGARSRDGLERGAAIEFVPQRPIAGYDFAFKIDILGDPLRDRVGGISTAAAMGGAAGVGGVALAATEIPSKSEVKSASKCTLSYHGESEAR